MNIAFYMILVMILAIVYYILTYFSGIVGWFAREVKKDYLKNTKDEGEDY